MKKAFIQLHIAVLLAGLTGPMARWITLNEGLMVWYRLLITAVTMWLLFSFKRKINYVSAKDMASIAGIGIIAMLHWVTFFGSIKYSSISVGLVCFSAIGFFTSITEPLLLKRRIQLVELLLGLLVMMGIYIIFHFEGNYQKGIIIGLISSLLASVFPILNRIMMQKMNAETLMSYEIGFGFVFLTLLMPLYISWVPVSHWLPTTSDWLWLLLLSWLCSVWAFILSANALKKISAFTVNLTYNLEPLYGIAIGFCVYHEYKSWTPSFYVGFFMIILAVALQTWRVYKKHAIKGTQ